jgi:hypothetical protein
LFAAALRTCLGILTLRSGLCVARQINNGHHTIEPPAISARAKPPAEISAGSLYTLALTILSEFSTRSPGRK